MCGIDSLIFTMPSIKNDPSTVKQRFLQEEEKRSTLRALHERLRLLLTRINLDK